MSSLGIVSAFNHGASLEVSSSAFLMLPQKSECNLWSVGHTMINTVVQNVNIRLINTTLLRGYYLCCAPYSQCMTIQYTDSF